MSNASKNKGKSFERDVAKFLGDVFGLNFERVPNSGAFIGGKNNFRADKLTDEQKLLMDGDIIMPKALSHVSVECKSYKDFRWSLLYYKDGVQILNKWIDQSSNTSKTIWFICFKINNMGCFTVFDSSIGFEEYCTKFPNTRYFYNDKVYTVTSMNNFFNFNKEGILNYNIGVK
jgi:hypothetical protein